LASTAIDGKKRDIAFNVPKKHRMAHLLRIPNARD
jgi:hypothetical protein